MPTYDVPWKVPQAEDAEIVEYTYASTASTGHLQLPPKKAKLKDRMRFYRKAIGWLWKHREEPNNRHKWRRMMREVVVQE